MGYLKLKKPGKNAHQLARALYLLMKAEEIGIQELANKAGVNRNLVSRFLEGPPTKPSSKAKVIRKGSTMLSTVDKLFSVFEHDLKVTPRYSTINRRNKRIEAKPGFVPGSRLEDYNWDTTKEAKR